MNISDILVGVNSSALNVPLNHTNWLLDYKINGQKSYVYKDKDILHELYRSPISANDEDIQIDAFNYMSAEEKELLGVWLSKNYGFRDLTNLSNYKSIDDIISDADILNRIKVSEFSDSFFGLTEVATAFALTASLKNAASDNDIMTLLESSDAFKAAVASNADIRTDTVTSGSLSVENAFVLSAYAGAVSGADGTYFRVDYRSSITEILHGTTDSTTLLASVSQRVRNTEPAVNPVTLTINKFVKKLTVSQPSGISSLTNKITYIQLDNVV